jgi:hypothetical protein
MGETNINKKPIPVRLLIHTGHAAQSPREPSVLNHQSLIEGKYLFLEC